MDAIIRLKEIKSLLKNVDVISAMEEGFIQYSNGNAIVPPVGEMLFDEPKGETHIKYGYIKNDEFSVIKVASGFYDNPKLGISSSQGLMLLLSQKTGQPISLLLDEGYLTDIRTAAAGALVAKYFAPKNVKAIGIIGTGIQARLQLEYLQKVTTCKTVFLWGRNDDNARKIQSESNSNLDITIVKNPSEIAQHCNLIVTTTPSTTPLLLDKDILPGTHITAVGSDTSEKQELESKILASADIVIADSLSQSETRGEIHKARLNNFLEANKLVELGKAIQDQKLRRVNDKQISIVDLTGVAVQDIMIAKTIYNNFKKRQL